VTVPNRIILLAVAGVGMSVWSIYEFFDPAVWVTSVVVGAGIAGCGCRSRDAMGHVEEVWRGEIHRGEVVHLSAPTIVISFPLRDALRTRWSPPSCAGPVAERVADFATSPAQIAELE
jgi:hypothetical protein